MPQYLVAIHHPDNYDPSAEDESMVRDIDVLTKRWRLPVPGSSPEACNRPPRAKSLRKQPGGKVVVTDGPYLEAKEHIGGFWILDAANMDEGRGVGTQSRRSLPRIGRGARVPRYANRIVTPTQNT